MSPSPTTAVRGLGRTIKSWVHNSGYAGCSPCPCEKKQTEKTARHTYKTYPTLTQAVEQAHSCRRRLARAKKHVCLSDQPVVLLNNVPRSNSNSLSVG